MLYALCVPMGLFAGFLSVWGVRGRVSAFVPCMRLLWVCEVCGGVMVVL